ncbi:carbohydrate ABC transporter permease [Salinarchaeum laminariae]|uniref:carbohydrate ABC transporter permease n=1 Tax=Salinarchaeum laminariae TaxID=869888 RepID=UPI0020BF4625|nr:sugar ABC transporter permease [Salinarchaeum laminariae]
MRERIERIDPRRREVLLGYLLVLPSLLLIGGVILYPLIYNVYLGFTEVPLNPDQSPVWIGLENYETLVNSDRFWEATYNTVVFTVASALLATALGLAVALLFDRAFRGRRLARGLVLLPHVTPIIAVAFAWQFMLDPLWGNLPDFLAWLGIYESDVGLLQSRDHALQMAILFDVWRNFPFAFLLFIARLQAIPQSMYEAATIDGAGRFAQFKDIILPELKGTILIAILLRFVWEFNAFEPVWLLTRNLETLPIYAYKSAFSTYNQGLGAAIAVMLFLFQLVMVAVYMRFVGEDEL